MRRLLLASVATTLVLAGCGGDGGSGNLDDVDISSAAVPEVTVEEGFEVTETATKVVSEGSGDEVSEGDIVKVNYVAVNGRTGETFDSSFAAEQTLTVATGDPQIIPGFAKGLDGQDIGSRILVAISPEDGFGQAQPDFDLEADDTMVFLFDVVSEVPKEVTGEAQDLPSDVPSLEVGDDGVPTGFAATDDTPDEVTESSSHVVIEGEGDVVEAGQTVTVQYLGQIYPGGETFDESYSRGSPLTSPLGGLVPCWQEEMVGQTVGSRIVLVCPADTAYGDSPPEGGPIQPGDTLLFTIDLLDAS